MNIKAKLTLGVGILFLMILALGISAIARFTSMAANTKNILAANYNSLGYARHMLKALDELPAEAYAWKTFESNLAKQQANVTEAGEQELTESLARHYLRLKERPDDETLRRNIRSDLNEVMKLNMSAIERKSKLANEEARDSVTLIGITGTLCILIALTLLINLPGNIANPIKELTQSIKQIAAEKYSERVYFDREDEFSELAQSFNTMAGKLEEYNNSNLARLMMEKKRIETLIDNMQDPVIGLDEHHTILFANEQALSITGLKREEIVGKSAQQLSVTNDLIRSLLQSLIQPTNQSDRQAVKIYANGRESYFEKEILDISIVPTGEQEQQLIGHVIVLRNVTSYKEADFAKTNFIATVSHEFKTPISSIKMSLQLLENEQTGPLSDEQKQLLESIEDDANRLLRITGELLNMTQAESGKVQLNMSAASPAEIVQYALNANKLQAEQKNIRLQVSCPDDLPAVLADSEKTAWVLTNLVSNAIRYSYNKASVSVTVSEQEGQLKFSVKDTGQGIAPEYKEKVFDRYFRVPGTQKEGTGLGLAISKEFIEAQGGSIHLETDFGAGSEFIVLLNKA